MARRVFHKTSRRVTELRAVDEGAVPASAPATSRLFVLPVAARRWVSTDNNVTMPFGLRNTGATYQRCMLHVFKDHIGRTVEAYVDDIVVKSRKADDLVADLRIAFDCLRAKG